MLNQITTQPWRKGNPTSLISALHKISIVFGEVFGFYFFIKMQKMMKTMMMAKKKNQMSRTKEKKSIWNKK